MYVRKTTRRYKDKTYTNYLLVESVHHPQGAAPEGRLFLG